MKYQYSAVFTPKESGTGYYCRVPDLPGCITTGKDLPDALEMIADAASAWLLSSENHGDAIPRPSPQSELPIEKGDILSVISVDTDAYRALLDDHTVVKMVALPDWIVNIADHQGISYSDFFQSALKQRLGIA